MLMHPVWKMPGTEWRSFSKFCPIQNWLPWQHPLRYQKKRSRTIICTQNAFIRWKDCENQSSGSWDNPSPRNHLKKIKKKKLTQAKYITRSASLQSRLKKLNTTDKWHSWWHLAIKFNNSGFYLQNQARPLPFTLPLIEKTSFNFTLVILFYSS